MATEALLLPRALHAPWAAYEAIQPALQQILEQNRADWVRRMARGNTMQDSWHSFHDEARTPGPVFTTAATALLVRIGAQTIAFLTRSPRGTADLLDAQGLGTSFTPQEQSAGLGDGLLVTARISRTDVDLMAEDIDSAIRDRLDQYPGRTNLIPDLEEPEPIRTHLRLVHSVKEPVGV